jgi:hypothetical protein
MRRAAELLKFTRKENKTFFFPYGTGFKEEKESRVQQVHGAAILSI